MNNLTTRTRHIIRMLAIECAKNASFINNTMSTKKKVALSIDGVLFDELDINLSGEQKRKVQYYTTLLIDSRN